MEIMQNSTGRLVVGVFDLSVAAPVENANVVIKQNDNGNMTTISELTTDISGQTPSIDLSSPPRELSLEPENETFQPYSEYDVEVNAEGFEPVTINGVQIFSGTLAIQNVRLRPFDGEEDIINIQPPTLWGDFPEKIPEDETKPLPEESGFVVLDRVVIPEYIVVHDGSPNDTTAPDYYIKYRDYIKNVASSEIYSTWPDAAIRANVLAIISFTLNRVFTEWYRNMGKNFTITSST